MGRIVKAAALAGALDGFAAIALYVWILGVTTTPRLFAGIAEALFPPGHPLLGVGVHFCVALAWTLVWAAALRLQPALRALPAIVAGPLFGAVVWFSMRLVVLPLVHGYLVPFTRWTFWAQVGIHMALVGPAIVGILHDRPSVALDKQ